MSLNILKKLTKEQLSKIVLEYQDKFNNILPNTNIELTSLRDKFTKI